MSNQNPLDPEEAKEKAKEISGTYQDYLDKLKGLKDEQQEVISEVVGRIEQDRIDDIKNSIED